MKNGLLALNVFLLLAVGYLLVVHFSSEKTSRTSGKSATNDSAAHAATFRIAYFEMDSVEANFQMVKDVKAELSKKENEINSQLDRLTKEFQQKYNYFQGQAQAGKMNQTQSESASLELKNLDEQIKNRKQTLDQEYNDLVMRRMKDVKTCIEDFLKEYNKDKRFAYIVSYEQGLFFYKDSALNITSDLIRGLNNTYKKKKS
ncbi:MAG TPA: OmpH family outer membrane protein [Chitinophagaceae bacterium]|nr:OmpH family outer membrane protein [Chitinophagaceae bacterium]